MKTALQSNSAPVFGEIDTASGLQALYCIRSGFSILWVVLLSIFSQIDMTVGKILLVLYPVWDVICTFIDIRISGNKRAGRMQYANCMISVVATTLIAIALQEAIPQALIVFGCWAILTGLIQLIMAVGRKNMFTGQWPMIISGGQSTIAGSSFIILAHAPTMGIASLAGYAAFGAFYYLLSAISLNKEKTRNSDW